MMMNTNVMLGINEVADCVVGIYKSAQKNGHKMPMREVLVIQSHKLILDYHLLAVE